MSKTDSDHVTLGGSRSPEHQLSIPAQRLKVPTHGHVADLAVGRGLPGAPSLLVRAGMTPLG